MKRTKKKGVKVTRKSKVISIQLVRVDGSFTTEVNNTILNELSLEDALAINRMLYTIVDEKREWKGRKKKLVVSIGDVVTINHKKVLGIKMKVIKKNPKKVILQEVGNKLRYSVTYNLLILNPK